MNTVSLVGRMVADPIVRYSAQNTSLAIARFTVAVDRRIKKEGEQTADFIQCLAFGKTAEFIERYFFKGSNVGLIGRIQTGSYENKDGQKVYTTEILAENVEFVDSKNGSGQTENKKDTKSDFMNIPDGIDDDLPFN